MKKILLFLTILFSCIISTQPAVAEEAGLSISLFPATQTISLEPGQTYSGELTIANTGTVPFSFQLTAVPYQVDSETYDPNFSLESNYTQLCNWITFAQSNYHLEPGESAKADFTVNVPEGVKGGGQYAAILARSEDSADPNSAIQVASQVAALLYGRVSGEEMHPEGELVEQIIPSFILNGPLKVSETIYNTGNVDFKIYHAITVTNFFTGETVITPETKASDGVTNVGSNNPIVLPGTSRSDTLVWDGAPKLGIFRVKQEIVFLDENISTEQIVIFCPIWLIIALIVLLLLAILWIILAARKRKHKQPQVF